METLDYSLSTHLCLNWKTKYGGISQNLAAETLNYIEIKQYYSQIYVT